MKKSRTFVSTERVFHFRRGNIHQSLWFIFTQCRRSSSVSWWILPFLSNTQHCPNQILWAKSCSYSGNVWMEPKFELKLGSTLAGWVKHKFRTCFPVWRHKDIFPRLQPEQATLEEEPQHTGRKGFPEVTPRPWQHLKSLLCCFILYLLQYCNRQGKKWQLCPRKDMGTNSASSWRPPFPIHLCHSQGDLLPVGPYYTKSLTRR